MDYKDTLNLPRTKFSMKADLPRKEPDTLSFWQREGIYEKIMHKYSKAKKYILHDGPPYANGNIHIGHALNKILKDIVIKFETMQGKLSPYIPGWDCHGLPVEHQLFKELGIDKSGIGQLDFRKKAYRYAMKFVELQKKEFERLGVFADWQRPYLTLDPEYEYEILSAFKELVKEGYIYRGLKPVNWCTSCETALAEAEVEYNMHKSPSIYVKFKMKGEDRYILIWTTTPWTLVANAAVTVHPGFKYAAVKAKEDVLIMASELVSRTMKEAGIEDFKVLNEVAGKQLEGLVCEHPFIDRGSRVVTEEYVSMEEGTGCVHTAPGHGEEDYATGLKYGLEVIMPVGIDGRFDKTAGEFSGMKIDEANPRIIDRLKANKRLLHASEVEHSYPHCWRCGRPIAFRATNQWFMNVDHKGLREKMLKAVGGIEVDGMVRWVPSQGQKRIYAMLKSRPDWCLSRQRFWGVPIPAFYCKGCGKELLDAKIIDNVAAYVRREGSDAWFTRDADEFMPDGYSCPRCKGRRFEKEKDILDVWFDSGVSHTAVLKKRGELGYPADIYLEGSDQHRGWFQTALISAMPIYKKPPFRTVVTHGFVVDGEGRKMSKSLGNVIAPQDVQARYGADILRLWVASSEYYYDVRISEEILERLSDAYRKIRNTSRFILGNISDFDPKKNGIAYSKLFELDRYALSMCADMLKKAENAYRGFAYHTVYHTLYNFCTSTMSNFYLDILKDRLYTFAEDSLGRRSAQTALHSILDVLVRVSAPIIPFTAEEVWQHLPAKEQESVHLAPWPGKAASKWQNDALKDKWAVVLDIRPIVLKALEGERIAKRIGNSLEAAVTLYIKDKSLFKRLSSFRGQLNAIFIVSDARLEFSKDLPGDAFADEKNMSLGIRVEKAKGKKCARCWNYSETVGQAQGHPSICSRCAEVIGK